MCIGIACHKHKRTLAPQDITRLEDTGTHDRLPSLFILRVTETDCLPHGGQKSFSSFYSRTCMYICTYSLTSKHIKTKHRDTGPPNCEQGNGVVQMIWCCWLVIYFPTFRESDHYVLYLQLIRIVQEAF